MAFNDIFTNIFSLLYNDPSLVPGILGPRTVTNMRLYRAWPNWQTFLTTYEPNQPAEGWIVIEEPATGRRFGQRGYASNHEYLEILFHIYATTFAVTHDALDVLDTYFHWTVDQERDMTWGDRIVLFTRRYQQLDKYIQETKLSSKDISYFMEFVRMEDLPD